MKGNTTDTAIYIVTTSWALNISCSIFKFVALIIEKIKKARSKTKVANINKATEPNKTEKEIVFTKYNS